MVLKVTTLGYFWIFFLAFTEALTVDDHTGAFLFTFLLTESTDVGYQPRQVDANALLVTV